MRIRNIAVFSAAIFVGAVCGSLIGPRPVAAVAREIIDLQRDVTSLLQGQKDLSTQMTQDHTVIKTIVGGFNDNISRLSGSMGSLQKSEIGRRLNSSHVSISYAVFCLKKKKHINCRMTIITI